MPLAVVAFLMEAVSWGMLTTTTQPATGPTTQPASAPSSEAGTDPAVIRILEKMEAMGNEVKDLQCRVEYTVEDLVGLDEFTKFGAIVYKRSKPNPFFKITFRKMHQGGVVVRKKEWYLFAERWFYEAKESSRTVIKREVIREGEVIDLFSLEKSPFPIPFGQRKDEILEHYNVRQKPSAPGDPEKTDHLVWVPKPGSRLVDEYGRLEFFVSRSLHLPVKIVATQADPNGQASKIITAVFPDLGSNGINAGLKRDALQLPRETSSFQVIEEPLDRPDDPAKSSHPEP